MLLEIKVTQEDIDQGEACNSFHCPVARAVRRVLGRRCSVALDRIAVWRDQSSGPKIIHEDRVDSKTREWYQDFDMGLSVKPFSFHMDVPDEIV